MGVNKTVLITGATGYIGANLCLHFKAAGYTVIAYCHRPPETAASFEGMEIVCGDIREVASYEALLHRADIVVHTISLDHHRSDELPIDAVNDINVLPVWQLAAKAAAAKVQKFIYLSTIHVLGALPPARITEQQSKQPKNIYGLTHALGEDITLFYGALYQKNFCAVRLSNGYGSPVFPANNCWSLVVNDLCRTAYHNKKIVLHSDGTAFRDFIQVNDIAGAILKLAEVEVELQPVYNIASSQTYSLLETAHAVKRIYKELYGEDIPVFHSSEIVSVDFMKPANAFCITNDLLLETGFSITYSLDQGIKEIFEYLDKGNYES